MTVEHIEGVFGHFTVAARHKIREHALATRQIVMIVCVLFSFIIVTDVKQFTLIVVKRMQIGIFNQRIDTVCQRTVRIRASDATKLPLSTVETNRRGRTASVLQSYQL